MLFIAIIPIAYILGPFALNLNIFFIVTLGFIEYVKGARFKINNIDKLVIILFFYILFTSVWNTVEINFIQNNLNNNYYILNKSLFFLRYLLLYLSLRVLIENKVNLF